MATNARDGAVMLAAAERNGRQLVILHPWRHHDVVIALRGAIRRGEVGSFVRTDGYGVHARWALSGWFVDPALAGGGVLIDMGIHAIDTASFLLGDSDPRRVVGSIGTAYGDYRVDDNRVVLIEWEGGVRSTIECGWWQLHLGGHEADTDVLGTGGYQRIWPLEQPAGYEHCGQPLFAAQMCEVTAALERFTSGDRSSRRGLTALAICDRASASAGVLV